MPAKEGHKFTVILWDVTQSKARLGYRRLCLPKWGTERQWMTGFNTIAMDIVVLCVFHRHTP